MSKESKEETLAAVNASLDEKWANESLLSLRDVARRKRYITVDDLWGVIDAPEGDQAKVGAVMRRASAKDINKYPNGCFLKSTPYRVYSQRGNHDNVVLWESKICFSGDESMPELATLHADPSIDLNGMMNVYKAAKKLHTGLMDNTEFSVVLNEVFEPTT